MIDTWAAPRCGLSEGEIRRSFSPCAATPSRPDTLSDRDVLVQRQFEDLIVFSPKSNTARLQHVRGTIRSLAALPVGWDSYGAQSFVSDILATAERFMTDLAKCDAELPSLVPTSRGGLALEWHRPAREFSIELEPASLGKASASVFFSDDDSGEEWEQDLADVDMAKIQAALARFA